MSAISSSQKRKPAFHSDAFVPTKKPKANPSEKSIANIAQPQIRILSSLHRFPRPAICYLTPPQARPAPKDLWETAKAEMEATLSSKIFTEAQLIRWLDVAQKPECSQLVLQVFELAYEATCRLELGEIGPITRPVCEKWENLKDSFSFSEALSNQEMRNRTNLLGFNLCLTVKDIDSCNRYIEKEKNIEKACLMYLRLSIRNMANVSSHHCFLLKFLCRGIFHPLKDSFFCFAQEAFQSIIERRPSCTLVEKRKATFYWTLALLKLGQNSLCKEIITDSFISASSSQPIMDETLAKQILSKLYDPDEIALFLSYLPPEMQVLVAPTASS